MSGIKKYGDFVNEYQSVTKPIENSNNPPKYDYKNIADVLGYKSHSSTVPNVIVEFEEKILNKMKEEDKPKSDASYIQMFKEYQRNRFNETPPYSDDLIDDNDFGARAYQDDVKMEMENESKNEDTVNEDGVAAVTGGNVSGMGAVVTSQPSSVPGQTLGGSNVGDSFGNGGTVGSGDIGAGQIKNKNVIKRPEKSRRKKKLKAKAKEMAKNLKNTFKGNEYKQGGDKNSVLMTFTEFSKKK